MTRAELVVFAGNERQAWFLAELFPRYPQLSEDQLVNLVAQLMVCIKLQAGGRDDVIEFSGERRDTVRQNNFLKGRR